MKKEEINLKDLVKGNKVFFQSYRQGVFFYRIEYLVKSVNAAKQQIEYRTGFTFPVPVEDIGTATLRDEDKAITFMRWIRKAIEDGTLLKS